MYIQQLWAIGMSILLMLSYATNCNAGTLAFHSMNTTHLNTSGIITIDTSFVVRPGDGSEFVYSPIHVNATLHCVVDGLIIYWMVDGLNFIFRNEQAMLNVRGIFEITKTSSELGLKSSTLTVYGDIQRNNNISICCETREDSCCTTLIIYGIMYYDSNINPTLYCTITLNLYIDRSSITTYKSSTSMD